MRKTPVMLAMVLCTLSIAALSQERKLPDGVTVLSEDELRSKFIGNTVSGFIGGTPWSEFYLANGVIKGVEAGDRYGGEWSISGNWMCYDYQGTEYDGCNSISLSGDEVRFYAEDGTPDKYPTGTLLEGNAKGL